jgi:hypothetical protein
MVNEGIRTSCKRADEVAIEVEYVGVERHIARHELEFWLACTVRKCRQFTSREVVPTHVGFAHACEHDPSEMERYFGRPHRIQGNARPTLL